MKTKKSLINFCMVFLVLSMSLSLLNLGSHYAEGAPSLISWDPYEVVQGDLVTFSTTSSGPYKWWISDGPGNPCDWETDTEYSSASSFTYTFYQNGYWQVCLQVPDEFAPSEYYTEVQTVTVTNHEPEIGDQIGWTATPEPSSVDESFHIEVPFTDYEDQAAFSCTIDYGDNTEAVGGTIEHDWDYIYDCIGPAHTYTAANDFIMVTATIYDGYPDSYTMSEIYYHEVIAAPWVALVVNSTNDVIDGTCDTTHCSLREAISAAASGDTITFDSTLSGLTISLSSQLTLDKDVTIDGSALASKVSISGTSTSRVFSITSLTTVTMDSLIITGGNNNNGGGVYNGGTLTINNSSLVNNTGAIGGGIINNGKLSITDSTLSQNSASNGGALENSGVATITRCTISENHAVVGAGIEGSYGSLTVRDSTISANIASERGGGIFIGYGSQANIFGATVVNNTAGDMGGGGMTNMGTTSVVNSTFTGNVTASTVRGSAINNSTAGGNLTLYNGTLSGNTGFVTLNNENNASISLANTIIANTTSGWDCSNYFGTIAESKNNWVSDGDIGESCGATNFGDPMLAALADNGGPTQTMALQAGSGAIGAGDDSICAGTLVAGLDQRGVTRPQGLHCDIGAFEFESTYPWEQLPGGESQQASYYGNQSVYDDFVLSQTETIREVEFWSSTPEPMTINVGFYTNSTDGSGSDIPGEYIYGGGASSIFTTVEDPAVCSQAYCAYRHSFRIELPLYSGQYWISIFGEAELYWSSAADMTGSFAYYPDGAVSPTLGTGNLAFRLLNYNTPKLNTLTIEPSPSIVGLQVYTDLRFSDPDSSSHTGVINWGDGVVENADYCGYDYCYFPDHTYTTAGTYTVQAWVTDSEGHSGALSKQHVVSYFMVPPSIDEWLASDTVTTTIEVEAAALEGHIPVNFNIVSNPEQRGSFGTPTTAVCQFEEGLGAYICRASVEYTPPAENYNGYDNFNYTIDDGQGNVSSAATVPLWVAPNTPPTAQPRTVQVSTILPTTILLTATDPDFHDYTVDRLSIVIGTGPTQGMLSEPKTVECHVDASVPGSESGVCNYQVTYTPNAEVTGTTDSFTFSVFDTHQYSMPGTVSLEFHAPVTWTVNTSEDVIDEFGCNESPCSLREAVDAAWNGDIIEFNLAPQTTIVLEGSDVLLDKNLIINGPGADQLIVSGGADLEDTEPWKHDRVFTVGGFELMPVTVTINGLTIRDGRSDSGGGVIVLDGSHLTMNDCVIGPNNIVTYAGGGVFNDRAHLTMNRCTVTGNEGTGSLGGAGVTTAYSGATTTLINSTVSGNITNNFGGGLFVGPECVVSLINTTVSGNISNFNYLDQYEERGGGAGIYIESGDWSDNLVYLQNSIVAGNTDMTDPATAGHEKWPDVYGEVTSLGGNLIGDDTGSSGWLESDLYGTSLSPIDPKLDVLAWNLPGTTQTMALLAGSQAIDAVPTCEVTIDQRGVTRPQPVGSSCDIGAYELVQTASDTTPPELTITGAMDGTSPMAGELATGYILQTANNPAVDHLVQFADETSSNELLKDAYFGLYLVGTTVSAADLQAYYIARGVPDPWLTHLIGAANGTDPFVYIKGTSVTLVDAAQHDHSEDNPDNPMTIPDDFPLGTYTVAGDIEDLAGNKTTITLILIVAGDRVAPVIAFHADVTAEATSAAGAIVSYTSPTTSDNVDSPGTADCTPASGSQFGLGETTINCTAIDVAGNVATPTTFAVHVVDTTAPEVTVPGNMTVPAPDELGVIVPFSANATDIVGGSLTPACNPISGSLFPVGSTVVGCSATDAAGNIGSASFTITVTYTAPVPLSQLTTAKTTCIQFSSGTATDVERLLYTSTYNKKILNSVIKSVTPSTFLYYVKANLPAEASSLVIAQVNNLNFPAMLPSVTLYDANCVRLSPTLGTAVIANGNVTVSFTSGAAERVVYVGVKYSARPIIGQVVTEIGDIEYYFSAALNGVTAFTSDDLVVTYIQ